MTERWRALADQLQSRIGPSGFEVLGAVTVGAHNDTLEEHLAGYRLPEPDGAGSLVLVIGNTKRLWPLFMRAYEDASLSAEANPIDRYTSSKLDLAVAEVAGAFGVASALRYTFDAVPRAVAVQRLTILAGVAEQSPVGLLVHPEFGPWFSLRAAAVFGLPGPAGAVPPATCSRCSTRPCLAAKDRVHTATGGVYTRESFDAYWQLWLGMRESCPVGAQARFSEQQTRYHYLKRLEILHEQPSEHPPSQG
jgi:hypothetical protein